MIFVTVGTHEQPFNRLVKYMDNWASEHEEEVVIQTGFSTYEPKKAKWQKLFPYNEMLKKVEAARIVITHGGPSSFIMPLQIKKIPIVVPRKKEFGEHVNNHQVDFCEHVSIRYDNIIVVDDVLDLDNVITSYNEQITTKTAQLASNNAFFCTEFGIIIDKLLI